MKHGQGVYTWAEGVRYTGEFVNDAAVGIGALKASPYGWYEAAKQAIEQEDDSAKATALLQIQLKITPQHAPSLELLKQAE